MKNGDSIVQNGSTAICDYIGSIDMDALSISFCERFDEKSHIWNFDKHRHDYLEFIYFLDGRALINVAGKRVNLPTNDLIAYPPGVMHQEFLDMHFHQEIVCVGVDVKSEYALDTSFELCDRSRKLRWLFVQVYDEYTKKEENYEALIKAYLSSIFLLITRHYKNAADETEDVVSSCVRYIHDHFSECITLEKLAAISFVSPSYLTRVFQASLGVSPIHYIISYRIEVAKQLLRSSKASVTEIAEYSGFNDQKYFSRIFSKRVGESPRSFRKAFNEPIEPT